LVTPLVVRPEGDEGQAGGAGYRGLNVNQHDGSINLESAG
jgi:hypothetical protein